jgi:hypothetical protein
MNWKLGIQQLSYVIAGGLIVVALVAYNNGDTNAHAIAGCFFGFAIFVLFLGCALKSFFK